MTLFTQQDELGPERHDHAHRVEHWRRVVIRLSRHYQSDYMNGDLRTRFAIYHAIGLIADAADGLSADARRDMSNINWAGLSGMRVILVHFPWRVDNEIIWAAATTSVPELLSEIRRYIAR